MLDVGLMLKLCVVCVDGHRYVYECYVVLDKNDEPPPWLWSMLCIWWCNVVFWCFVSCILLMSGFVDSV